LPALRLGQFGPHGHAAPDHAISQNPENRSGLGRLYLLDAQARAFIATRAQFAVTCGAALLEKNPSGRNRIGIILQRIMFCPCLLRDFAKFSVGQSTGAVRVSGGFVVLREGQTRRENRSEDGQRRHTSLH
jgi:hypothetical protein